MKKVHLKGKLSLNKKTVSHLNDIEMSHVKGGEFELAPDGDAREDDRGFLSIIRCTHTSRAQCSVSARCIPDQSYDGGCIPHD